MSQTSSRQVNRDSDEVKEGECGTNIPKPTAMSAKEGIHAHKARKEKKRVGQQHRKSSLASMSTVTARPMVAGEQLVLVDEIAQDLANEESLHQKQQLLMVVMPTLILSQIQSTKSDASMPPEVDNSHVHHAKICTKVASCGQNSQDMDGNCEYTSLKMDM